MSYCRFADDSDVYVYLDVGGYLCCCACPLGGPYEHRTTAEMFAHLSDHERAGHLVPARAYHGLSRDAMQADLWIAARNRTFANWRERRRFVRERKRLPRGQLHQPLTKDALRARIAAAQTAGEWAVPRNLP